MSEIDNVGQFPIVGEPGTELITFPPGTQIFPNTDEMLWQIAQKVAERDSMYCDGNGLWRCPFCGENKHDADCIVIKARELMEWRKQQSQIKVTVRIDGGGYCNAPLPKDGER